jgi:hypothetical protein
MSGKVRMNARGTVKHEEGISRIDAVATNMVLLGLTRE